LRHLYSRVKKKKKKKQTNKKKKNKKKKKTPPQNNTEIIHADTEIASKVEVSETGKAH